MLGNKAFVIIKIFNQHKSENAFDIGCGVESILFLCVHASFAPRNAVAQI